MNSAQVLAYIPSPSQGVWHLGPIPIRAYALCIVAGILVALWWGSRRWIARGGQPGEVLDVALFAVPFGLIGGRAYHVLTDWRYYFTDLGQTLNPPRSAMDAFKIWDGGLGIWGAVALGAVGAWIGCKVYGIRLPAFGDAIAPAILLAQAIGRFGNYFNQEVYGRATDLPWGLEIFQRVPDNLTGVSTGVRTAIVHPTFLYEALWNVLFVLVLVAVDRYYRVGHGRLFALYVMGYCFGRFFVELVRDDPASEPFGMGIRVNSIVAVVVFGCALAYFLAAPRGRELGLSMYRPKRAAELEAEGKVGYIDPWADDDADDAADVDATDETDETDVADSSTGPSISPTGPSISPTGPSISSTGPDDELRVVSATREVDAPAAEIFALIADPAQQPRFDGNENLAEAEDGQRVSAVGDVFQMTNTSGRVRENTIVEFETDRLIAWKPSEVGGPQPGHLWRWELEPVDDRVTLVTHTYDWTGLDPDDAKRNERARATTAESLLASLDRMAALFGTDETEEADEFVQVADADDADADEADADKADADADEADADADEAEADEAGADDADADEEDEAPNIVRRSEAAETADTDDDDDAAAEEPESEADEEAESEGDDDAESEAEAEEDAEADADADDDADGDAAADADEDPDNA